MPAKVQALVDASANVTYVNASAEPAIEALAAAGLIHWQKRDFNHEDLTGRFLVIADHRENADIFRLAEESRVLCNCVDDPSNCRFTFGSVHRQGELTMAISTNGRAPALAVRLKEWLQREVGSEYAEFIELLKEIRPEVTSRIGDFAARRALWYRIVDSEVVELLRKGQADEARAMIRGLAEEAMAESSR